MQWKKCCWKDEIKRKKEKRTTNADHGEHHPGRQGHARIPGGGRRQRDAKHARRRPSWTAVPPPLGTTASPAHASSATGLTPLLDAASSLAAASGGLLSRCCELAASSPAAASWRQALPHSFSQYGAISMVICVVKSTSTPYLLRG